MNLFPWLDLWPLMAPADTLGAPEPAPEPVTPPAEEPVAEEPEAEDIADEEDVEDSEELDDEEEGDSEELDIAGTKLAIPKGALPVEAKGKIEEIVRGFQADYTRKTQEVAEKAKSLETREGAVQKLATLNDESLNLYAKGLHLQQEIQQLAAIDKQALWQSDPDQARQLSDVVAAKQAEFQTVAATLNRKEQELAQTQASDVQRRDAEGRQFVSKAAPNFDEGKIVAYVTKEYGIPEKEAKAWPLNPQVAVMAHKAMLYDEMQAKAKKPAPKPAAQPVKATRTTGKAGRRGFDPVRDSDMPADDWFKAEQARMAAKAKAAQR